MTDDRIECLLCGRRYHVLSSHLARTHGISGDEYRAEFDIAQGDPLASESYRAARSEVMTRNRQHGLVTNDHLPRAVEASRNSTVRPKRGRALEKQRAVLNEHRPWEANQLEPGAQRADGRDADHAREYQRDYRARRKRT